MDYFDINYLVCPEKVDFKRCRHNGVCILFLPPSYRDGFGGNKTPGPGFFSFFSSTPTTASTENLIP